MASSMSESAGFSAADSTVGVSGGLATSAAATASDEIELSCKQPANGRTNRTSPKTQLEQIRVFMVDDGSVGLITRPCHYYLIDGISGKPIQG